MFVVEVKQNLFKSLVNADCDRMDHISVGMGTIKVHLVLFLLGYICGRGKVKLTLRV